MRGSVMQCHFATVLNDDLCRLPQEFFFAELRDFYGHPLIKINIPTTQIVVDNSDDSDKLECGKYNTELATSL